MIQPFPYLLIVLIIGLSNLPVLAQTGNIDLNWKSEFDSTKIVQNFHGFEIWELQIGDRNFYGSYLEIPFSLNDVKDVLYSGEDYKTWLPNTIEVEKLERTTENSWLYYNATDLPWPFKDRQSVIKLTLRSYKHRGLRLDFRLGNYPGYQMDPNRVCLKELEGSWIVLPKSNYSCEVAYIQFMDYGGNIPSAMARPFIQRLPLKNILALRDYLDSTKSITHIASIK